MTEPTKQSRLYLADIAIKEICKKYRVHMVANNKGEYWLAPVEESDKPELRIV